MRSSPSGFFRLPIIVGLLLLSGCATTQIVNQWSNPAYTTPAFKKFVIIGISDQASIRRNFEDEFVTQLKAIGVSAVPGYQFLPEAGQVEEARLKEAVKQSGAEAAVVTKLTRVEKRAVYTPGPYVPLRPLGFYHWYNYAWDGFYDPAHVNYYDVYLSETSLFDVTKDQLVWSGAIRTTWPDEIGKEINSYIAIVITALKEKNLLPAGPGGR